MTVTLASFRTADATYLAGLLTDAIDSGVDRTLILALDEWEGGASRQDLRRWDLGHYANALDVAAALHGWDLWGDGTDRGFLLGECLDDLLGVS